MTNPRDTGRYDAITDTWIDQQVQIDFAWGNVPMQPNDDRGMAQLDPELDSHIIATSGYEGFPSFISGAPYDDTVPNAVMPNIVGMTQIQAEAALAAAGFESWDNNATTSGATSGNDGKVASQYPGVGTVLNTNDQPQATYYNYVNPGHPIAGLSVTNLPAGWSPLTGGQIAMYLVGRTVKPTVGGDPIKIVGNSNDSLNQGYNVLAVENDDHYNTGGTVVKLVCFEKALLNPDTNSGGTWQDYFA